MTQIIVHAPRIFDYFQPPSGINAEWTGVFECLVDPIKLASSFLSNPVNAQQSAEYLASHRKWLLLSVQSMREVVSHLNGPAPKTFNVGNEVDRALFPVHSLLGVVIGFLEQPVPCALSPEQQAAPSRKSLVELTSFDWVPLLERLATAVWAERNVDLGLSTKNEKVMPPDIGAYVPAKLLWSKRKKQFSNSAACTQFLRQHKEIRTYKPSKNRLMIHAGDWTNFWEERAKQRESLLRDDEMHDHIAERLQAAQENKRNQHLGQISQKAKDNQP